MIMPFHLRIPLTAAAAALSCASQPAITVIGSEVVGNYDFYSILFNLDAAGTVFVRVAASTTVLASPRAAKTRSGRTGSLICVLYVVYPEDMTDMIWSFSR